jgi:purine-binding chemotaxis protein CheW
MHPVYMVHGNGEDERVSEGNADLDGLITFRLCGQGFAFPVEAVREVVPIAWLATPPHMPAIVQGILNFGGTAVPVLRLDRVLGLADGQYGLDASILLMRSPIGDEATPVGLLVEHVDGVRAAAGFTVMAFSDRRSFNGCLAGELERDGVVRHLLSWERVLLTEERLWLADFQAKHRERLADLADAGS